MPSFFTRAVHLRGQHDLVICGVLAAFALAMLGLNIRYGGHALSWHQVLSALTGTGERLETLMVWKLRLPRAVLALVCGASLGLAGYVMQSALRNPLGAPDLTGATMGGVVAVVIATAFFPWIGAIYHPFIALAGGLAASGLVIAVSLNTTTGRLGLILAGAAVSAFCGAGVMLVLAGFAPTSLPAYQWLVGSLAGRGLMHLQIIMPWFLTGAVLTIAARRPLVVMRLTDEAARAAGLNLVLWRSVLVVAAVGLTAGVVAVSGAVAFLGLIAPHLARMTVQNSESALFIAPLYGAVLMISADLLAKTLAAPREIPLGLFLGFLGAPILIYLIRNSERFSRQLSGEVS